MSNLSKAIAFSHDDLSTAIIKEPITVSPETPVMEVVLLMSGARSHCNADSSIKAKSNHVKREARASCVIVVEFGGIVGILTERDVVRLSATKQSLGDLRISQVMATSVVTVKESSLSDLFATINLLQQNQIRHLPIVDEQGGLVGLVTHETLRELMQPSDLLRLRLVREVMVQDVVTADPTDSLLAVAQKMANRNVSSVVIVDNRPDQDLPTPIGMVTERDLVQFQALELEFERYRAEQVMSHPVVTVAESEALVTVQQLMESYGISRVVVTGSADEMLGIVTQSNLIQALSPFELYKLTEVLEAKVNQLESEKLNLLQNRNLILETQVMSRTEDLRKQLQREQAVNRLSTQIRSSMSLQAILDTAVDQIHEIVGCDRINVWKFENDFSWTVMAESANPSYSLIGTQVQDESYLQYLSRFYFERDICIVADMFTTEMEKSYRDLSTRLHIRAEVLLPLFCGEKLWGLLSVAESNKARDWQVDEIDLLRSIMTQLDIAVQQASTHEQLYVELHERQKAETILQIKNLLLTRVAAQENLTDTLNHICITLEGLLEGSLCSILLLDSHNQLHEGAAPSLPDAYCRQIDGISVGEGVGSCGTALHRREKVIVTDIANDPLWRNFKDLALEFGLRACWSNPIVATDQSILGAFGIYYQEVHAPTNADMALVDDLVPIITLAIQRHQNETVLKQTTQRLQEAQRQAHLGNWEIDLQKNILYWSEEVFRIFECDPLHFIPTCEAFVDLIHPDERAAANANYIMHLQDRQPFSRIHRLQMPDGRIKYGLEHCETIYSDNGTPIVSRGTIQDITQQKEAELHRDRAEASLRQVIEGTASLTGEHFFPALVRHISEALGVRYVSVDQAMSGGFQILSFFTDGEFCLPSFLPYDEVPYCLQSLQAGICCIPTNARSLYPDNALFNDLGVDSYLGIRLQNAAGDPIGNLCILHDSPLVDPEWSQTLLTILAARAGAELERLLTSQALESLNAELEDRVDLRTAELAEREARYRGLMDGAPDAIFLADFEGNVRDANPSAVEMLGYSLAELTSMHFRQIHPAEELNKLKLHFADLYQNHRAQITDVKCIRRDGSIFFVDIKASAINVGGEMFAQGIFRDISDRLQIENALRESQQFLQTILDTVPLAVFWKDRNSTYLGANRHFLRDAGLSSISELVGKNDFDLPWTVTEAESYRADDRLVIESESEKLNFFETQHQQGGKEIWVETNKLPLRNLAGEILGVLCTYQDITVRKQIELALRESETRFRRVFESNVVGMMFTDFNGLVTDANDRFLEIIGLSRTDLEANRINWAEITPSEYVKADFRAIDQLLCQGEVRPWETKYMHQDGSFTSVLIGVALLSSEYGRFVAVVIDISDRKEAEAKLQRTNAELERATRLKDEFLANMSHELRTPLNSILGMTEGLQEKVFGTVNEKQLKALSTVERSATHLLALINDILDVAKIESGKIILDLSPVSIEQLCSSSLNFVKQQAHGKRIQLKTIIPPHLPDLLVDETRIRQVLLNLITNAVKFTPEGGQITLTVNRKPFDALESPALPEISDNQNYQPAMDYIQIAVTDTGIGIAPENINKLFQPFVQIDSALNRQYAGTGLGLSLVKKIVELHGGNVTLTSELGEGSCFTVNLPYHSQVPSDIHSDIHPENIAIASESEHSPPDESKTTPTKAPLILLADDNPTNVATITSYLEAKGYSLLLANNGQEAIDLAISDRPDLILMDIQMPVMDGLEAMRQIRLQDGLSEVPIIALTALTMKGDREKCLAAGANSYLSKPVKLKQLTLLIQELL